VIPAFFPEGSAAAERALGVVGSPSRLWNSALEFDERDAPPRAPPPSAPAANDASASAAMSSSMVASLADRANAVVLRDENTDGPSLESRSKSPGPPGASPRERSRSSSSSSSRLACTPLVDR
jgi:hypothetical protein